jgi:serine/threonine-protein kinase HipA
VPALDLDLLHFPVEQWKMAGNVSISGLQPKLSMEITKEGLQTVEHGGRFILKPQSPKYRALPENEHLTMRLAMACGIVIPPCCLLALQDGTLAYVVRRYDRLPDGGRLRQEDFCQLNGWHADRKYEGSAELCIRLLRQHVPSPGPDIRQMFRRLLFTYLSGNGDMHLKNVALLIPKGRAPMLAPAYDLLCTRLVEPRDDLALPVCGKRDRLKRRAWLDFAAYCQIDDAAEEIEAVLNAMKTASSLISHSPLPVDLKDAYRALILSRLTLLGRPAENAA